MLSSVDVVAPTWTVAVLAPIVTATVPTDSTVGTFGTVRAAICVVPSCIITSTTVAVAIVVGSRGSSIAISCSRLAFRWSCT